MVETVAVAILATLLVGLCLSYFAGRLFAHKLSDRAFDIYLGVSWYGWLLSFWIAALFFPNMLDLEGQIDWISCLMGGASGVLVIIVCDLMYSVEEKYTLPRWLPDLTTVMALVIMLGWVWYYIEHPTKNFHSAALGLITGVGAAILFPLLRKQVPQ
jgi:hypothetical protein